MNIGLIITLGGDLVRSTEHVGIGYLAAVLRKANHNVIILEIEEKKIDNINDYIPLLKNVDLVGFTTTCITLKNIIRITKLIKKYIPKSYILYGGHMATFGAVEILEKYPFVNFIILGEGELTIIDLVETIENNKDLSNVKGLVYRKNDKIIQNENRTLIEDLDTLPFPERDQFEMHNQDFQYLRISTSRGCLGNCGFCSSFVGRKQKGSRWRGRSPQNIVDEIEMLTNKYNFHTYDFVDSTFEDPGKLGKERIYCIAQEIISRKLNIYYNCCFRAENWTDSDDSLLEILVDSGLEKVNIGFESGNDKGLKILNKRATMEDNQRVIRVLKKHPMIYITFGFIMLHPYSTLQDIKDNADFLHNTGIGQIIRHYFWMLEVYPGTLMEEKLKKDNLLKKGYDINDGMYMYNFKNSDMNIFVPLFKEMLSLNSVWDFEIFDILVHTFITRLIRKYEKTEININLMDFKNFLDLERKKIADFNYNFFIDMIATRKYYNLSKKKEELNNFLISEMNIIKIKQYKLGLELRRKGYSTNIK